MNDAALPDELAQPAARRIGLRVDSLEYQAKTIVKPLDPIVQQFKAADRNTLRFFNPGLPAGPGLRSDARTPGAG